MRKPDPRTVLGIVDQMGFLTAQVLMVGDSSTDIFTAINAGLVPVNGELKRIPEIGLTEVFFKKSFLKVQGTKQEYELHNFHVESDEFEVFGESKNCSQSIKHKQKPFYGVLFHPEVRNKQILINFAEM